MVDQFLDNFSGDIVHYMEAVLRANITKLFPPENAIIIKFVQQMREWGGQGKRPIE